MSDTTTNEGDAGTGSVGSVSSLRAFPVKSLDAPYISSTSVLSTGLAHDRAWAVVDDVGQLITAKQVPALRDLRAAAPPGPGESPTVWLPGQDVEVPPASTDGTLSQVTGRSVALRQAEAGYAEVAPVHLVSRQSIVRAAEREVAASGDEACVVEEPRANIVVDLGPGAELETEWVGREVELGDVVLRISRQPKNCLGVYADVVEPGLLNVGDVVRLR